GGRRAAGPAVGCDPLRPARRLRRGADPPCDNCCVLGGPRARALGRRPLLDRGRGGRAPPRLRALARPPRRPAPARPRVLHHERRDQRRLLRLRDRGRGRLMSALVTPRGLGKRYGDKRVLDGLDFGLDRGGFMLVTGPNGSGKTTLLRLCAGLAVPSAGTLEIAAEREEIGFAGHDPLLYRELTAIENLDL